MQEPLIRKHDDRGGGEVDVPAHRVLDESGCVSLDAGDVQHLLAGLEKLAKRGLQLLDQRRCFLEDTFAAFALVIASEQVLSNLKRTSLHNFRQNICVDDGIGGDHSCVLLSPRPQDPSSLKTSAAVG